MKWKHYVWIKWIWALFICLAMASEFDVSLMTLIYFVVIMAYLIALASFPARKLESIVRIVAAVVLSLVLAYILLASILPFLGWISILTVWPVFMIVIWMLV